VRPADWKAWLWQGARLTVGFLFVMAAAGKLRDPIKFMGGMDQYGLVHGPILPLGAVAIPGIELLAGLSLLLGFRPRAAASVISGLLLVFIGAMLAAMHKGLELDCSCFDLLGVDPSLAALSPALLNAILAGIAVGVHSLISEPASKPRPWLWRHLAALAVALWLAFGLMRAGDPAWHRPLVNGVEITLVFWFGMDLLKGGFAAIRWGRLAFDALLLGPFLWLVFYKLSDGPSILGWGTVARDVAMLIPAACLVFYGPAEG
jgi:putative oxidoreductase